MDGFYKPHEEKHDHMYENKQHSPLWLLLNLHNNAFALIIMQLLYIIINNAFDIWWTSVLSGKMRFQLNSWKM